MLNGRFYLLGALYDTRGSFSHLPRFVGKFADQLVSLPYEREAVLEKVRELRRECSRISKPIGEDEALKLMLAEDLHAIESVLENETIIHEIDRRQQIDVE